MRYSKIHPSRTSLRKFASDLVRSYPAWIDSGSGVPFSASVVCSRVRDSLVLRLVAKRHYRELSDVQGAR